MSIINYALLVLTITLVIMLYHIRNEHNVEQRRLNALARDVTAAQALHQTMRAEWSSLNAPMRLAGLADKYLALSVPDIAQLVPDFGVTLSRATVARGTRGGVR